MSDVEKQLQHAVAMHQAGSLAEAERGYRQILERDRNSADAANLLGVLCCQTDRADEGMQLLRDAAASHPEHPGIQYNLANAMRDAGDLEAAEQHYRRSLAGNANNVSALVNLGATLQELGRLAEAAEAFRNAIGVDATHIAAQLNLADALWRLGDRTNAIEALRAAIVLDPTCLQALQYLGKALLVEQDYSTAADVWQSIICMNPTCADYYHNLGQSLEGVGRLEHAEEAYREAINRAPGLLPTRQALARVYVRRSRLPEAVGSYQAALQLVQNDDELRASLLHELGDVFDQLDEYGHALDCYRQSNALRGKVFHWDEKQDEVERTIGVFTAEAIPNMPRTIRGTDRAVFIVATPGSETIVRSILARHPDVHDGGATELLARAAGVLRDAYTGDGAYPQCLQRLRVDDVHQLADDLACEIDQLCVTRERLADTSITNALHLGLASLLTPRSRVIWVRRDPVDAGLTCFCDAQPFARDLGDVGRHIALTNALMQHWSRTLDMPMLIVEWNELMSDPAGAARTIIDFVDLPWNDRCAPTDLSALRRRDSGPNGYGPHLGALIETLSAPFGSAQPDAA